MLLHYMVEKLQSSKHCYSVKVSRFIVDIHDSTPVFVEQLFSIDCSEAEGFCVSTAHVKRFKHAPFQTTEMKCFAESWICATIAQEINHNSKSIYPTHKIIISPDRG